MEKCLVLVAGRNTLAITGYKCHRYVIRRSILMRMTRLGWIPPPPQVSVPLASDLAVASPPLSPASEAVASSSKLELPVEEDQMQVDMTLNETESVHSNSM